MTVDCQPVYMTFTLALQTVCKNLLFQFSHWCKSQRDGWTWSQHKVFCSYFSQNAI